jgi:hypothetical protein
MSFLYSLKRHVGKGRIYIVWDNSIAHHLKYVIRQALRKGIHQEVVSKYLSLSYSIHHMYYYA